MIVTYITCKLLSTLPGEFYSLINVGNDYLPQLANIFLKSQIVNILSFKGHVVFAATIQISHCITKAVMMVCKSMGMAVFSIKLCLQKQNSRFIL